MVAGDAERVQVLVVGAELADVAGVAHTADAAPGPVGVVRNTDGALTALAAEPAAAVLVEHDGPDSPAERLLAALPTEAEPAVVALVSDEGGPVDVLDAGATDYVSLAAVRRDPGLLVRRLASIGDLGSKPDRQWYRSLLERTTDVLTVLEADGLVRYASPSIRDVLGYEPADLVGELPFEYIHENDRERVVAAFQSLLSGEEGDTVEVQYRFQRADGERIWVESVASSRPEDAVGGYVVSSREITERKQSDRELEHYETLLSVMPDTVVITDMDGIQQEIHGFEGWSGYEPEELVGEHVSTTTPEADIERGAEIVGELIRDDDKREATYETRIETKDGELIPFENHMTLLPPDADGRIPGSMSVLRNVADRKERERRLKQAETVFQNAQDAVFLVDVTDNGGFEVERVNESYEAMTGLQAAEVRGKAPREYLGAAAGTRIEEKFRECVERRAPFDFEVECEPAAVPTHLHTRIAPVVVDGEVTGIVGTMRDVTERKERERRLEQAETVFQNAQDAVFLVDITDDDRYEIRRINRSYEETTGMTADDLQGRTLREIFGDEIGTRVEAKLRECGDRREPLDYEETLDVPGLPLHWHTRLAPVIVDDDVVGIVGATRDITERKEREAELELKNRAMDEAPIGITIADATRPGRPIVYANDGFAELTGYDELEIQGRDLAQLAGPETNDRQFGELEQAMDRAQPATSELLCHRADGTPVWTRLSVAPVTDETGEPTHIVGFQQNISERKEYEKEIERRFDEFGEIFAEELGEPIETARTRLATALEDIEDANVESAAETLDRTERLLDDLTTVHSFSVPSREVSEATLLGSRGVD